MYNRVTTGLNIKRCSVPHISMVKKYNANSGICFCVEEDFQFSSLNGPYF